MGAHGVLAAAESPSYRSGLAAWGRGRGLAGALRSTLVDDDALVESADKLDGRTADGVSPVAAIPSWCMLAAAAAAGCLFIALLSS